MGREESRQASYFPAAYLGQRKAVFDRKNCERQFVPCVHQKWHTDTFLQKMVRSKAQEMVLNVCQTFSYAAVLFGDIPAYCTAGVVGHDQTMLYEEPSEVTLKDPRTTKEAPSISSGRPPTKGAPSFSSGLASIQKKNSSQKRA